MKKLLPLIWAVGMGALVSQPTLAQTYPSPTYQNTTVLGTLTVAGHLITPGVAPSCTPIEAQGGGTGVSNNTTAYNASVAAFGSGPGCISFGPGTYTFTTAPASIVYGSSTESVTIVGSGADVTTLSFAGVGGITFTMGAATNPSFHVRDMTLSQTTANTGTALTATFLSPQLFQPALSDITGVTIDGGTATSYWLAGIQLQGVSNVDITNTQVIGHLTSATVGAGLGLNITGDAAITSFGVEFNINGCVFQSLNVGIQYGTYVQGVSLVNTNVNFNNIGLLLPSADVGAASLNIMNSFFNNWGVSIFLQGPIFTPNISNNNFIDQIANSTAISITSGIGGVISNNTVGGVTASGTAGFIVTANASYPLVITGNSLNGLGTALNFQAGATLINLQSNGYNSNTTKVFNAGSITAGNCTGIGGTCTAGATP